MPVIQKYKYSTILITGATSGIGLGFAKIYASQCQKMILVSRNLKVMQLLKRNLEEKYKIKVFPVKADLAKSDAALKIYSKIKRHNIDFLINNSGFGYHGHFYDMPIRMIGEMVNLNITALTELTHLLLKPMIQKKHGTILNVASTGAFQPGPLISVYYATKAYVLSFSAALSREVKGKGINVHTLCPGPTKTGFQKRAKVADLKLMGKAPMSGEDVARYTERKLSKGKKIIIPGIVNKLGVFLTRFFPMSTTVEAAYYLQNKRK